MLAPRMLVLDEPLANLDPRPRSGCSPRPPPRRRGHGGGHRRAPGRGRARGRPDRALYLDEGEVRYLGPMDGFLAVADPASREAALRRPGGPRERAPTAAGASRARAPHAAGDDAERPASSGATWTRAMTTARCSTAEQPAWVVRQRVAVLGPNGSGKTTMFKTAIGLVPRHGGEVRVDGDSIAGRGVAELAGTFGYVFQNPSQMLFAATSATSCCSDRATSAARRRARSDRRRRPRPGGPRRGGDPRGLR